MTSRYRQAVPNIASYLDDRIVRWRSGTAEGQVAVLIGLMGLSTIILLASVASYSAFPATTFVIPILLGALALRYQPLLVLVIVDVLCVAVTVTKETTDNGLVPGRISNLIVMVVVIGIVLFDSSRRRSGLPGPVGEGMLVDLRDRLHAQGVVPPLPVGWNVQSELKSAGGVKFAGDFMVANLSDDETKLEMILVDVCGKGVAAGTQSLQLAGALGGLIGALPQERLFTAGNDFLLRQHWDEGFATAVHVLVDLESGAYSVINAGHPPALRWEAMSKHWVIDGARGTALGILKRPEFHQTSGELASGDALMFYTDGVVESRVKDFTTGIEWLRGVAATAVGSGFDQAAKRILAQVESHDDDRALLIINRAAVPASVEGTGASLPHPNRAHP